MVNVRPQDIEVGTFIYDIFRSAAHLYVR
jgi:hypothetical protein